MPSSHQDAVGGGDTDKLVGVGSIANKDYHNFQLSFTDSGWTDTGSVSKYQAYANITATAASAVTANGQILNVSTGVPIDWADNKMVIVEGVVTYGAIDNKSGWGFGDAIRSCQGAPNNNAGFVTDATGNFFTYTGANGVSYTETAITSLASGTHRLRIEADPANATPQIRFYVDGVLVSTHTTNLDLDDELGTFEAGNGAILTGGMDTITAVSFAVEV